MNAVKRGRPPHEPTPKDRKTVEIATSVGIPQPIIARIIGVHETTLRDYYRDELDLGKARANMAVCGNLFRIATGNSPQAAASAMFWTKTNAGWKETVRQENTGADGKAIEVIDVSARDVLAAKIAAISGRIADPMAD